MLSDDKLRDLLDLERQARRELGTRSREDFHALWNAWTEDVQQHFGPVCEELLKLRALKRSVSEALNSGDGVYRP